MAKEIFEKIVANLLNILWVATFTVLGFLVVQIFALKGDIAEFRVATTEKYGELDKQLALNTQAISDLGKKFDKLNGTLSGDTASLTLESSSER